MRSLRLRHRRLLYTLRDSVSISGVGLHSGIVANVRLRPAVAAGGIHFVRTDVPGEPRIRAQPSAVVSTMLSTTIGSHSGSATVATIEHLMAALYGARVSACRIEVDAPELPVLDGSAAQWMRAINEAGLTRPMTCSTSLTASPDAGMTPTSVVDLPVPVRVVDGESWAIAIPACSPRLSVGIDFASHAPIGRQWATWAPVEEDDEEEAGIKVTGHRGRVGGVAGTGDAGSSSDGGGGGGSSGGRGDRSGSNGRGRHGSSSDGAGSFEVEVAPARTFALHEQLAALREAGLIKGGSLENALVCDTERWLNGPLRFENEPARHKLLDLVGDLALLGPCLPRAHIVAYRSSHRLNHLLAQAILECQKTDATRESSNVYIQR